MSGEDARGNTGSGKSEVDVAGAEDAVQLGVPLKEGKDDAHQTPLVSSSSCDIGWGKYTVAAMSVGEDQRDA